MKLKQMSKILALLIVVCLVFTLMPTTVFALEDEDTDWPDIGTLVANPASAKPGDIVTISATVTDESDIIMVTVDAFDLNYNDIARDLPMTLQAETDIYQAEITIPADVVDGNCTINIYAEDEHGNGSTVPFWEDVLIITGGASDTAAPLIGDALTVSPTSVQPNGTVTVSTTVTDDSDIVSVSLNAGYQQSNIYTIMVDMIRQDSSNTYQAIFTIPSDAVNGEYTVAINAEDKYSNRSDKEFVSAFTVTGGHDDISGPVIGDLLTVLPQSPQPGGTVTVSATVTDATAVDEVAFSAFIDNTQGIPIIIDELMNRQGDTDTYQGTFTVPSDSTGRNVSIIIEARDTYRNLTEKTFNKALTVTGGDSDDTTYTATLNIQIDGAPGHSDGNGYTLKLSTDETKIATMSMLGATRTASVPDGAWKVYVNWNDKYTGVTINVSGGNASATLDWFSSEYHANTEGTATSGTIGVTLNDERVFDDETFNIRYFIKGEMVTFTANGFGAENYTYAWSGTHNGIPINSMGKNYTIESVYGKVNLTCTITGSGAAETYTVTVSSQGTGASGSGEYTQGATVYISAGAPPSDTGLAFKNWTSTPIVNFANNNGANTSFIMPSHPVTVTANFDNPPAGEKAIFVLSDGNGMASVYPNSAAEGENINLYTTANSGYYFKEWQVIAGSVTIQESLGSPDGTWMAHRFTMPDTEVRVKAIFERIPSPTYTVTFDTNGGGALISPSAKTDTDGKLSSLPAPERSGNYRFDGWYTAVSGGSKVTTSTIFMQDTTIYAHWTYMGGGGTSSSGGSSSNGSTPIVTQHDKEKPDAATNAETKATPDVDASGNATVTVPEKSVTDAIKAAQDAAKKAGTENNGVSITIDATTTKGANAITATLPAKAVDALIKANVTEVRIKSDAATVTIDLATLKRAQTLANGDITFSVKPVAVNTLSAEAQNAIGNRPVFQLSMQSGSKTIANFGSGSVSVALPYTLGANEKVKNLYGVYVDGNGKVTYLTNSSYDTNTKMLLFSTDHFSLFGIGYKEDVPMFTDIANHWAKDDIDFVAARGLLSGLGNNQFSPDGSMTRGMFITALGRLADVDTSKYTTSSFSDVKVDAYYMAYIEWARKNNIVNGIDSGKFAPDQSISREQMAIILSNYAKLVGFNLPKDNVENTFDDNAKISVWAKDSVKKVQMAGMLMGKDGNKFDPQGIATRAEASAVLKRFVELAIDSDTHKAGQ